ncbi:MAG: hypothetical protein K0R54_2134 [Clostridiaceae bacterium]|jgi:hypothetical protein|nr:hypothetical protein [Clostridiaceae bacterium]
MAETTEQTNETAQVIDDTTSSNNTTVSQTNSNVVVTFTKEQILKSKKYMHHVDLINAFLDKDKTYSLQDVDKILDNFLKGDVK